MIIPKLKVLASGVLDENDSSIIYEVRIKAHSSALLSPTELEGAIEALPDLLEIARRSLRYFQRREGAEAKDLESDIKAAMFRLDTRRPRSVR